jgi:hypothetical protein
MGDDQDPIDQATHGSGIRNARRVGSDEAKVRRPGKQTISRTEDRRPSGGRVARKNRPAGDVGQD